jgi:hypothetical protein
MTAPPGHRGVSPAGNRRLATGLDAGMLVLKLNLGP